MSNQPVITQETAPAEEIAIIIDKIEDAIIPLEAAKSHVLIALLAMSLGIIKPTITGEEIQNGVAQVSEFMVMLLAPSASTASN